MRTRFFMNFYLWSKTSNSDDVSERPEDVFVIQLALLTSDVAPVAVLVGTPGIPDSGTTTVAGLCAWAECVQLRCGRKAPPRARVYISASLSDATLRGG